MRVRIPRPLAPERATLVAPILPLPVVLMSCLRKIFTSRKPNGIEPRRYAIGIEMSQGFMVLLDEFSKSASQQVSEVSESANVGRKPQILSTNWRTRSSTAPRDESIALLDLFRGACGEGVRGLADWPTSGCVRGLRRG